MLVVDDDPQVLWHIRNTLTDAGYTPVATWDPEELAVDYARRRVTVSGRDVVLTDTEYRLLCELAVNAGRTLSREHLMSRVWSTREPDGSSVMRAYIRRLRRKLGETADNPTCIFNEPRVGYRLGDAEAQDPAS